MAEKAAHLTSTTQLNPSIFDFIAQENLNSLLHPSIKRIIDVLALRNNLFVNVSKYFDEYFLFGHFLLQFYYLKKYGATFSEKFYMLQRVPVKNSKNDFLGKKELFYSLLLVTLFPYLKSKLNHVSDKMSFEDLPRTNQKNKKILMKSVIYCNSGLNMSYQLMKFVQHLLYLSGKTEINSPLLWAAGVKLKYCVESPESVSFSFRNFIPQLFQRSLEIGAFFIQFLQWWQTEKGTGNMGTLPVPPPPPIREESKKYKDKCPLCLKKREIDTVLSTSGFIFCFKCITSYLAERSECPITKFPSTVHNLIRLYPSS